MAIPDYQTLMLPVLKLASDGREHKISDVIDDLSSEFGLTEEERNELLPSGNQSVFRNRISWARTYLKQAGLLFSPKRGFVAITKDGLDLLDQKPKNIDVGLLEKYTAFLEFKNRRRGENKQATASSTESTQTPEDVLSSAYGELQKNLEAEVLSTVMTASAEFFERLVVDLLVKMGYGGSRRDAGKAVGKSGDSGIDGIIKEDRLGLDAIYIQAKKWNSTNPIGRPEIQKFAGALQGQRAKKGVFITTSFFTREAAEYVKKIDSKIVLIDGELLSRLMVEHNIGVSTVGQYEIKKLDYDYFDDV